MWVVKLGGSLSTDPALPQWLTLLAQLGGGRVTIVPGGGGLANEVRRLQTHWGFDDLPAHNMAVLAMLQNAWMCKGLQPTLQLVDSEADIPRALRCGKTLVWAPHELLRTQADATTNWEVTSDSIALALASRLNAERLLLVKHEAVDPQRSLTQLVHDEVLDLRFGEWAQHAAFPITLLGRQQLDEARSLLLGDARGLRG